MIDPKAECERPKRSEIQDVILNILKVVIELLEHEHLRYFAIGGTCLGAVRHKGFIPWDDDIDIAMPIEDFERFLSIAPKILPDYLDLFVPTQSKHDCLLFIKVMDSRTMMTENRFFQYKDTYVGAWIDIFPLSGIPSKNFWFIKQATIINKLSFKTKSKCSESKSIYGKAIWLFVSPLRLLPIDFFWKRYIKLLENHPFDSDKYKYTGFSWTNRLPDWIFPKACFSDSVYLDFEDTKIRCPIGYHEYLNLQYGDYMSYPPLEDRNSGHLFDQGCIDLKHSYKDYQSGKISFEESSEEGNS